MKKLFLVFISSVSFSVAHADTKTIYLSEESVAQILVGPTGTVLSFPAPPSQILLSSRAFRIEKVESDVALTPLAPGARANLYAYVFGRRFNFKIQAASTSPALYIVRDEEELRFKKKGASNGAIKRKR